MFALRYSPAQRRLVKTLGILLLGYLGAFAGRTPRGPAIVVTSSEDDNRVVFIKFDVVATTEPIVLQGCPGAKGTQSLCNVWVEVLSNGVWKPVRHRSCGCKRGYLPTTEGTALSVSPHGSAHLTFIVNNASFRMEKGQRLRLFADAWHDEQSMRRDEKRIRLTSQAFTCP